MYTSLCAFARNHKGSGAKVLRVWFTSAFKAFCGGMSGSGERERDWKWEGERSLVGDGGSDRGKGKDGNRQRKIDR